MKNCLRKCLNSFCSKTIFFLQLPCDGVLFCIKWLGRFFEQLENLVELFLLWLSLFSVTWQHVNNKHFLPKNSAIRKKIASSGDALKLAKITIDRMSQEHEERKKVSSEKIKILFQTITFVFTIETGLIAYLYKDNKASMSLFFIASIALLAVSLFMIICYYKVSSSNSISYGENNGEYTENDYYSDILYCIEMNNRRLDYFVTIYKSSLRYFLAALVCLIVAIIKQFYMTITFL